MKKTCGNCRFSEEFGRTLEGEPALTCHRYPPALNADSASDWLTVPSRPLYWCQPAVAGSDWCGEWQRRKRSRAKGAKGGRGRA